MDGMKAVAASHVMADPTRHAGLVFDLIHAHESATTRMIDPMVVDRHRVGMLDTIAEIGPKAMASPVTHAMPANVVGAGDRLGRGRVQTMIAQVVHFAHLAMMDAGLSTSDAMRPLAAGQAMFAAALADEAYTSLINMTPEAIADYQRRAIAA